MVHGLLGTRSDWKIISQELRQQLKGQGLLLYASKVNQHERTLSGIDTCGKRVAEEIRQLVAEHPSLRRISFLGHSMGGLISRYAVGANFDPVTKTVFGLEACHFVTIATPHLGCHTDGEAQVPFLGWVKAVPFFGTRLITACKSHTSTIAAAVCRLTGRQLFLADGSAESKPLLLRLVDDVPLEGFFYSALSSFRTRTVYANCWGDALVSWANASLRRERELPWSLMKSQKRMGVFQEDPIHRAVWPAGKTGTASLERLAHSGAGLKLRSGRDRDAMKEYMLDKLRSLPWLRVDVSFKGVYVPVLAHTHIQVARRWIDYVGLSVVEHICRMVCRLEEVSRGPTGSVVCSIEG